MKWEPSDIIRLSAIIGSLIFFALGAIMMWQGIAAEGAIDIKSSVLTGSIKTGSAGLFISFLAFAIVVYVLSSLSQNSSNVDHPSGDLKSKKIAKFIKVLFICLILSVAASSFGYGAGFGGLAIFFGFILFMSCILYMTVLESE